MQHTQIGALLYTNNFQPHIHHSTRGLSLLIFSTLKTNSVIVYVQHNLKKTDITSEMEIIFKNEQQAKT